MSTLIEFHRVFLFKFLLLKKRRKMIEREKREERREKREERREKREERREKREERREKREERREKREERREEEKRRRRKKIKIKKDIIVQDKRRKIHNEIIEKCTIKQDTPLYSTVQYINDHSSKPLDHVSTRFQEISCC
jgi:FtsZ-interacting cell division protein YlmF